MAKGFQEEHIKPSVARDQEIFFERNREKIEVNFRDQDFHGFLSLDDLHDVISNRINELDKIGYQDVDVMRGNPVYSYTKNLFAAEVRATLKHTGESVSGWITLEFDLKNNKIKYRLSLGDIVVATTEIPPDFDMDWLQRESEASKVVKSRPPFLYPELFHLPPRGTALFLFRVCGRGFRGRHGPHGLRSRNPALVGCVQAHAAKAPDRPRRRMVGRDRGSVPLRLSGFHTDRDR